MDENAIELLVKGAREAALRAYAPYSHFRVGAALLGEGKLWVGCNVENASYGLTLCAERNALTTAIAEGVHTFEGLAIAAQDAVPPCGACCQVLAEFCSPEMPIFLTNYSGTVVKRTTLGAIFPQPFVSN